MEEFRSQSIRVLSRGVLLVDFNSGEAKEEVTERGIWMYDKKPLIVKEFNINESFNKEEMMKIPTWIRLPGLPIKFWSEQGLGKVGSLIGKPLYADRATEEKAFFTYARLLVEVNFEDEVQEVVKLRDDEGKFYEQRVIYEWRPIKCGFCNKIGHGEEVCRRREQPSKPDLKEDIGQKDEAVPREEGSGDNTRQVQGLERVEVQPPVVNSGQLSLQAMEGEVGAPVSIAEEGRMDDANDQSFVPSKGSLVEEESICPLVEGDLYSPLVITPISVREGDTVDRGPDGQELEDSFTHVISRGRRTKVRGRGSDQDQGGGFPLSGRGSANR